MEKGTKPSPPRVIALELTRSCILSCRHCRASATTADREEGELSRDEYFRLVDNIASFAGPILILSGGEPMLRPDLYEIAGHARKRGLPVALAPCGVLIDDQAAGRIAESGVRMVSISLDGADAETHDRFRGVSGAFEDSLRGIESLKRAGIAFQINTTVCKHNGDQIDRIRELAGRLGASLFNPFFLVATGRGSALAGLQLDAHEYETALQLLARRAAADEPGKVPLRVTCAPHYQRIIRREGFSADGSSGGCLGGKSFAFVSHRGKVQICGFLDVECGDLRLENYDFEKIWRHSDILARIRDVDTYDGKCGLCEYRKVCGGCRARAYAESGNYLGEEPRCLYVPSDARKTPCKPERDKRPCPDKEGTSRGSGPSRRMRDRVGLDRLGRRILNAVQSELSIEKRPFDAIAKKIGLTPVRFLDRLRELNGEFIKRIGPIFDSNSLGYSSTLIGARVPGDRLDEVASIVSSYSAVTHNYRREHHFNLWFTLITRPRERQDEILDQIKEHSGLDEFYNMPARRAYKIHSCFYLAGESNFSAPVSHGPAGAERNYAAGVEIGAPEEELIRLVQAGLPVRSRPFLPAAQALGWDEAEVVSRLRTWHEGGIIRRFGAVLQHRRVGFRANGMCVFDVPELHVDRAGALLAGRPEITHCYLRDTPPQWSYNLFAMSHSSERQDLRDFARKMADRTGAGNFDILFSTREYKKTPMQYFTEQAV